MTDTPHTILGIDFGTTNSVIARALGEGDRDRAERRANFGAILTLSGPVVLALTFGVAPAFYDAHAGERAAPDCDSDDDDDDGSADACFGDACYRGYFIVVIACAAVGALTSLELLRRRLNAAST